MADAAPQIASEFARGLTGGTAVKTPDQKPESVFDLITQGFDKLVAGLGKFISVNASSIGKTSMFANLNIEAGAPIKADQKITHDRVLGMGGDTSPTLATGLINGLQLASIKDIKSEHLNYGDAGAVYADHNMIQAPRIGAANTDDTRSIG